MSNSVAVANVTVQVIDQLQTGIPPVVFRTIPPVSYPSTNNIEYSGYTQLNPGSTSSVINTITYGFVYVRNAGLRGIAVLTIGSPAVGSQSIIQKLKPGGVYLFANPSADATSGINSLVVSVGDSNPVIFEYCVGT